LIDTFALAEQRVAFGYDLHYTTDPRDLDRIFGE